MQYAIDGKIIADNIRAERNRLKLTQEEVANKLGISNRTYISYEENAKNIGAITMYKLSLILNCKIDDFYCNKHSQNVK